MRLILAAVALVAAAQAQSVVQIKAGALTCAALRRTPPTTVPNSLNVQSYCYSGVPLVTNYSNLITPGTITIVSHQYGPGCAPGASGSCDIVVWQFSDAGSGNVAYQVCANGSTVQNGTLP